MIPHSYQMLGRRIADPLGVEREAGEANRLGHLDNETVLAPKKRLENCHGRHIVSGTEESGYEIHMEPTSGADCALGWLDLGHGPHGAASREGRVTGCYLHGLFKSDRFRTAWLAHFNYVSALDYDITVDETLAALADHLEAHLDMDQLPDLEKKVGRA